MTNIPVSNPKVVQAITVLAGLATVLVAHFVPAYSVLLSQILNVLGIGVVGVGAVQITSRDGDKEVPRLARFSNKRPPSDGAAAMSMLRGRRWLPAWTPAFLLMLLVAGCVRHVTWPQLAACAQQVEQPLLVAVGEVLAGSGKVDEELAELTATYAPSLVECAVQQLVSGIAAAPPSARSTRALARGRAFLARVSR